jgi:thiamine-phosphate pyrophosphorylase
MPIGRLHVITNLRECRDESLSTIRSVLEAGAPVVQVRAKGVSDRELFELTSRVVDLCAAHDAACIVNDRVDVALATGARGAHLGADDLPVDAARALLGDEAILGATARDAAAARAHQAHGASYLGVGPCFATRSKTGLPDPLGCEGLRAVAGAVDVPVIAIAGVTAERIPELLAAGAHGVAVIGAVWDADHPPAAVERLLRALEDGS